MMVNVNVADSGGGSGRTGIMDNEELQACGHLVDDLAGAMSRYRKYMDNLINSFSNEEIVQSFYSSGKYGEEFQERLQALHNGVLRYNEVIDELIGLSKDYFNEQRALNNRSLGGGIR